MASRVADVAQRVVVASLVGGTCFMLYTTVNQGRALVQRRKALEAQLAEMQANGEVPTPLPPAGGSAAVQPPAAGQVPEAGPKA